MKKALTVDSSNHIQQFISKFLQSFLKNRMEDRRREERAAAETELLKAYNNRDIYYKQMNYETDEHLIDYYNYLLKAEDKKIGYLRGMIIAQTPASDSADTSSFDNV